MACCIFVSFFLVSFLSPEDLGFLRTAPVPLNVGFTALGGWLFFADVGWPSSRGPGLGAFSFLVILESGSSAAISMKSAYWQTRVLVLESHLCASLVGYLLPSA
jgi:hypothetical protein